MADAEEATPMTDTTGRMTAEQVVAEALTTIDPDVARSLQHVMDEAAHLAVAALREHGYLAEQSASLRAEAWDEALRDARDALYRGEGPDRSAYSDIVYGEWLGNRADRAALAEGGGRRG